MGCVKGVGINEFPEQGSYLGRKVTVCFNYNTKDTITGIIVRDDVTEPYKTIIALADGRFVLTTECQYSLV